MVNPNEIIRSKITEIHREHFKIASTMTTKHQKKISLRNKMFSERIFFFFCKTAPCVTSPRTSLERKNTESKGRTRVVSFLYSLSPLIILYCTHQVTLCILTTHPLFTHTPIEIEENKQQQKSFFKNEIILLE